MVCYWSTWILEFNFLIQKKVVTFLLSEEM
jgi:hypothetical protein